MPLPSPQSPLLTSYYYATTVRIRPTTYHPTTPVPSELGLQPLFFVQPCSVATSAAHPTRYFHPLETRGRSREECTVKGGEGGSEVEWRKDFQDTSRLLFFPLEISAGFHTVFRVSFYRCLYFLSFCSSHGIVVPSMESYSFLSEISWIFDSMDLV